MRHVLNSLHRARAECAWLPLTPFTTPRSGMAIAIIAIATPTPVATTPVVVNLQRSCSGPRSFFGPLRPLHRSPPAHFPSAISFLRPGLSSFRQADPYQHGCCGLTPPPGPWLTKKMVRAHSYCILLRVLIDRECDLSLFQVLVGRGPFYGRRLF